MTPGVDRARWIGPDGVKREVPLDAASRELVYGVTARQGLYRVEVGTNRVTFASNLLDARESDIRPQDRLEVGRHGAVTATAQKRADLEHWRWFAVAALAVLLVEWWWYHRRTA